MSAKKSVEADWSVGIDFGHGETAVARVTLTNLGVQGDVTILEVQNKKSQITAMARDQQGNVVIGKVALTRQDVSDVRIDIKKDPSQSTPEQRERMHLYFRTLCEVLEGQYGTLSQGQSLVYVGVPSGWGPEVVRDYATLLRNHLVSAPLVVPESRAAMLHARETALIGSDELGKTAILIDIGSLTTDITLVRDLAGKPQEVGHELGAALIEKSMLRWLVDRDEQRVALLAAFARDVSHQTRCELECREAKERYFDPAYLNSPNPKPIRGSVDIDESLAFDFRLKPTDMEQILAQPIEVLGNRSWAQAFQETIEQLARDLRVQDVRVDIVLLTGGPARMGFVQDLCRTVFGSEKVRVDTEPEFAIARGLARYGRIPPRIAAFQAEIEAACRDELPQIVQRKVPGLIEDLAPVLAEALTWQAIKPAMMRVRDGSITSLTQLEETIKANAERWAERPVAQEAIANATRLWLSEVATDVNQRMLNICRRYDISDDQLRITIQPKVHDIGTAIPPFDTTPLLMAIGGAAVFVVGMVVALSAKLTAPFMLVTLIFPALAGPLEQMLRNAPFLGMGRFFFPDEARIDQLLREGMRRLTDEIAEYLRDPHAFVEARAQQNLSGRIGAARKQLTDFLNNHPAETEDLPPTPPTTLNFTAYVVAETVEQFEQALKARAREAERFIS